MELSELSKIFKALSNEQRLILFQKICDWQDIDMSGQAVDEENEGVEKAFTKACGCMKISRSTISHHIKELQNAGLITCTRIGQKYSCKVNEETLAKIRDFINK